MGPESHLGIRDAGGQVEGLFSMLPRQGSWTCPGVEQDERLFHPGQEQLVSQLLAQHLCRLDRGLGFIGSSELLQARSAREEELGAGGRGIESLAVQETRCELVQRLFVSRGQVVDQAQATPCPGPEERVRTFGPAERVVEPTGRFLDVAQAMGCPGHGQRKTEELARRSLHGSLLDQA